MGEGSEMGGEKRDEEGDVIWGRGVRWEVSREMRREMGDGGGGGKGGGWGEVSPYREMTSILQRRLYFSL